MINLDIPNLQLETIALLNQTNGLLNRYSTVVKLNKHRSQICVKHTTLADYCAI